MSWFNLLAEQQIKKSELRGELKNLEGEGKPLPEHPEAPFITGADGIAFRIMAEAHALPEEIKIKKAVIEQRNKIASIIDPSILKSEMKKLAELEMRQAIAEESRRQFFKE